MRQISVVWLAGSRRRRRQRDRLEGWTWVDVAGGFAGREVGKALMRAAAWVKDWGSYWRRWDGKVIAEEEGYTAVGSLGDSIVVDRLGTLAAPRVAEDGNQVVVVVAVAAAAAAVRELEAEQLDPMHMPVVRLVPSLVMLPLDEAASLQVEAELDTPGTVADRMPVAGHTPSLAVWPLSHTPGHWAEVCRTGRRQAAVCCAEHRRRSHSWHKGCSRWAYLPLQAAQASLVPRMLAERCPATVLLHVSIKFTDIWRTCLVICGPGSGVCCSLFRCLAVWTLVLLLGGGLPGGEGGSGARCSVGILLPGVLVHFAAMEMQTQQWNAKQSLIEKRRPLRSPPPHYKSGVINRLHFVIAPSPPFPPSRCRPRDRTRCPSRTRRCPHSQSGSRDSPQGEPPPPAHTVPRSHHAEHPSLAAVRPTPTLCIAS